jgi:hypothetical protein
MASGAASNSPRYRASICTRCPSPSAWGAMGTISNASRASGPGNAIVGVGSFKVFRAGRQRLTSPPPVSCSGTGKDCAKRYIGTIMCRFEHPIAAAAKAIRRATVYSRVARPLAFRWVPHPTVFRLARRRRGAVSVLCQTNRRGSIIITERALGWPRFLPLWRYSTSRIGRDGGICGRGRRCRRTIRVRRCRRRGRRQYSQAP